MSHWNALPLAPHLFLEFNKAPVISASRLKNIMGEKSKVLSRLSDMEPILFYFLFMVGGWWWLKLASPTSEKASLYHLF